MHAFATSGAGIIARCSRATCRLGLARSVGVGVLGVVFGALAGCTTTTDSLGYSGPGGLVLRPLSGPSSYPNAFRDVLGESDADIAAKIAAAFAQLFHGDTNTQAIYFTVGSDQADIQDVFHGFVPTEGVGYGMVIAVELDKQDEFDRLWTYAKTTLQVTSGSDSGYFNSYCQVQGTLNFAACLDPFGWQQFLMALLFANDRWGGSGDAGGSIDYAADAKTLLTLMRHKQDMNGGVVGGVTDTFDQASGLVFDVPDTSAFNFSRPSLELPAYYNLWAQATGDPFWTRAAAAGRAYLSQSADATTGLMPLRAYFDGTPVPASDAFGPQTYRAQLNMVLDQIWSGGDAWQATESDRLLQFFVGQGIDGYGDWFSLDGKTVVDATHDPGLVAMNGVSAIISSSGQRMAFVSDVWNMAIPSGASRYYDGILYLLSLLALGGQFQVI